jgi:hypothetical protein
VRTGVHEVKTKVEDIRDQLPDSKEDVFGLRNSVEEAKDQMNQLSVTALLVTTSSISEYIKFS